MAHSAEAHYSQRTVDLRVVLFASAREKAGKSEGCLRNVPIYIEERKLMKLILNEFSLESMASSIILAHNLAYVTAGEIMQLKEGDEVAVIPPISGG